MINIDKLKSTFMFKQEKYRAYFEFKRNKPIPIIEKELFSFLGFSFWVKPSGVHPENCRTVDFSNVMNEKPVNVIQKLRSITQYSIGKSIA